MIEGWFKKYSGNNGGNPFYNEYMIKTVKTAAEYYWRKGEFDMFDGLMERLGETGPNDLRIYGEMIMMRVSQEEKEI